jgi:hypothetical protein
VYVDTFFVISGKFTLERNDDEIDLFLPLSAPACHYRGQAYRTAPKALLSSGTTISSEEPESGIDFTNLHFGRKLYGQISIH